MIAGGAVDGAQIRSHFENQADACERLGSPFTARVCRALAASLDESTVTGRRVLSWPGVPGADALALRLCGGMHALVLTAADAALAGVYPPNIPGDEALASALAAAIARHDATLLSWLDSAPQTNEIARSGMLLPGFLMIARETGLPFDLVEIGASAGLNLLFDRYHYSYGGADWGDPLSPVKLVPQVKGAAPPLAGDLVVAARHAADVAPVRISQAAERLRLGAYVWPDQQARLDRLDAAIGLAQTTSFMLEKADAAEFVEKRLAERRRGKAFVLFHSIVWQYMPPATQARIEAALAAAGDAATLAGPIAWLRMEPLSHQDRFATLGLTLWPGGKTRHLARCDYHGRWIDWLALA
jgi:hypothetical protein